MGCIKLDILEKNFEPNLRVVSKNSECKKPRLDYYPFGMLMPGRNGNSAEYRYGFNGQEKDDEVAGEGNSYTAEFWQYDSRVARRWNTDPVVKYHESPYAAFANNPILFRDPILLFSPSCTMSMSTSSPI